MSRHRNRIEEQVLDALLLEALGKVRPPDLTATILTRLAEKDSMVEVVPVVDASSARVRPARIKPTRDVAATQVTASRARLAWTVALTTGLAASILLAFSLRRDQVGDEARIVASGETSIHQSATEISTDRPPDVTQPPVLAETTPSSPSRGIPLVIDASGEEFRLPSLDARTIEATSNNPIPEITLVSKRFDVELTRYWREIGIEPTGDASSTEITSRLVSILGVDLPASVVSDPQLLQVEIQRPEVAREVALRWLHQMTDRGLKRLDSPASDSLIAELAACFQGTRSLDRTVTDWINGQSPNAASFNTAVAHSGQDAMARRLADLTMNVDLRCIRCHDATIEGNGRQEDYWSFTALVSRGIAKSSTEKPKPLFYELSDGRQRLAEPSVAAQWLDAPTTPIETLEDWAAQLLGSKAMARGTVNSLWQLVHGQPLQGRIVDPISAPHHDALDQIEKALVDDLIQSQFDVSRTLSLIVASPVTRRGVPASLLPENALVVAESDRRRAIEAVNAFAAALPRDESLPLNQRLDHAMRAMGGKLDQDGRAFVAQIGENAEQGPASAVSVKPLARDFPVQGESLPVQWLTLIRNPQSQVDHLAYLAGSRELPESVLTAVKAMRESDQVSNELLLHRLWWLIRP